MSSIWGYNDELECLQPAVAGQPSRQEMKYLQVLLPDTKPTKTGFRSPTLKFRYEDGDESQQQLILHNAHQEPIVILVSLRLLKYITLFF